MQCNKEKNSKRYKKMNEYVSKERRRLEKELLMYLRKYRFYSARFKRIDDLNGIIYQIVNELKKDV